MREIVDGVKSHMNLRSDTQAAEFLRVSRQHLHISITKDKLMPERMLEVCLNHDIDITRLLRDGRATKLSDMDYSDTEVPVGQFREGTIIPFRKRAIPKWFAEIVFRREIGLTEVLGMIELESEDLEPKIRRDSIIYIDTKLKDPVGGLFYCDVSGYGMIRRLVKASEQDKWYLLAEDEAAVKEAPLTFGEGFRIIGRCQFMTTRI
jgi:hypothetical protein